MCADGFYNPSWQPPFSTQLGRRSPQTDRVVFAPKKLSAPRQFGFAHRLYIAGIPTPRPSSRRSGFRRNLPGAPLLLALRPTNHLDTASGELRIHSLFSKIPGPITTHSGLGTNSADSRGHPLAHGGGDDTGPHSPRIPPCILGGAKNEASVLISAFAAVSFALVVGARLVLVCGRSAFAAVSFVL